MSGQMGAYIRVSRVGDREGPSFISPAVQRERIESWARLHGVEIVRWWEELDQSGARRDRPQFQEALALCRDGSIDGIVVAKLDRFARSALDALEAIRQLDEAGARLVSVEDGFDDSNPMGQFARGMLLLLAELELQRVRGNWEAANARAVADGVHVAGFVPTGYRREGKRSPLVPDPETGPAVREAFRMRADGASVSTIAEFFEGRGILPPTGNPAWSRQGVAALLRNRVYLGQARAWKGMKNDAAHEPLVTPEEFEAAQSRNVQTRRRKHDGTVAAQSLLTGVLRCAGCGHRLMNTGTTNRDGTRTASYTCRKRYASGICPAPSAARAEIIDGYVRDALEFALHEGTLDASMDEVRRFESARRAVEKAKADLDALADPDLLRTLGPERLAAMAEPLRADLEDAKRRLRDTPRPGEGEGVIPSINVWLDSWGDAEPMERQRQFIRQFVADITLTRSGKRGRAAGPIGDRVAITWAGHDEPDATIAQRLAEAPRLTLGDGDRLVLADARG